MGEWMVKPVKGLLTAIKKSRFFKFKFLIALKINFNGVNFINKCQNLVISKSRKKS